jgi:(E)-4-hydroxy-3-methylbut-2-enyl-diphosphate synthase
MASVSTMDTEASVRQAVRMIRAGAEYIRFTARGEREARQLGVIRQALRAQGYDTPLVADIHFNPAAATAAAPNVEKVRINPGNYADGAKAFGETTSATESRDAGAEKIRDRLAPFLQLCKKHHTALRIGVNHGSLSDRIMNRYGDTPDGMVASCMEYLRICREEDFHNVVLSIKASNTVVMIRTVRLLVQTMDAEDMHYPLHLGVTEAGDNEDGRIKSAVGIGTLLADGIGDTIRVSLSEPPEAEIPVARKLLSHVLQRAAHAPIEAPDVAQLPPAYDFRRETHTVCGIGGDCPPAVISGRSHADFAVDASNRPDFIYTGALQTNALPGAARSVPRIVHAEQWENQPDTYPYFSAAGIGQLTQYHTPLKFVELAYDDLNDTTVNLIRQDAAVVIVWRGRRPDHLGEARLFACRLKTAACKAPLILRRDYRETDCESLQIQAAVDFGALLVDGIGNGIMLCDEQIEAAVTDRYMFGILQATRMRISKTEYISCPGCGRTLYDLQTTIARVKAATSHLKGLKIGIMGCIVNGPGEMADADYGYVGAGRGRVSLYKGKDCLCKNIPEDEAVDQLIQLIKDSGDWK